MKKTVKISNVGGVVTIETEGLTAEEMKAVIQSVTDSNDEDGYDDEDECDDDCDCDFCSAREACFKNDDEDDEYEDDEDDEDDEEYEDDDVDIPGMFADSMSMIDRLLKEKTDIVEKLGYTVTAKIVGFNVGEYSVYGVEVNKPVNGVSQYPEYAINVNPDGSREVVSVGNATLILSSPVFKKPIVEDVKLENYHPTGEVVTCKPGEDTVKGIAALMEMVKQHM